MSRVVFLLCHVAGDRHIWFKLKQATAIWLLCLSSYKLAELDFLSICLKQTDTIEFVFGISPCFSLVCSVLVLMGTEAVFTRAVNEYSKFLYIYSNIFKKTEIRL